MGDSTTTTRAETTRTAATMFHGHRADRVVTVIVWAVAALLVVIPGWIIVDITMRGLSELSSDFLLSEPRDAGRSGGIAPMVVSTMLVLCVTLVAACPVSLAAAVALAEYTSGDGIFSRLVRRSLDALAAVPSIVFGLFGNAFFCVQLRMGYSIVAGGLTLACMVLPIMILTTERALRSVPLEYKLGAAALGLSRTTILFKVQLPVAAPALLAGLVLGIGRTVAETAALLFTSGYATRFPDSLMDSGRVLSVHIFDMAMNVPGGSSRSYGTAVVLMMLLLGINMASIGLTRLAGKSMRSVTETSGVLR